MTDEQYEQAATYWLRKDEGKKEMEKAALKQWINDFLLSHKVLTLATGESHLLRCTPVEYCWYRDAIWIFSEGGQKFRALQKSKQVAVAVFDTNAVHGKIKSLQIAGTAELIEPFSAEYNEAATFRKVPLKVLQNMPEPMWLIKIIPSEFTCLDAEFKKSGLKSRQILRNLSDAE